MAARGLCKASRHPWAETLRALPRLRPHRPPASPPAAAHLLQQRGSDCRRRGEAVCKAWTGAGSLQLQRRNAGMSAELQKIRSQRAHFRRLRSLPRGRRGLALRQPCCFLGRHVTASRHGSAAPIARSYCKLVPRGPAVPAAAARWFECRRIEQRQPACMHDHWIVWSPVAVSYYVTTTTTTGQKLAGKSAKCTGACRVECMGVVLQARGGAWQRWGGSPGG